MSPKHHNEIAVGSLDVPQVDDTDWNRRIVEMFLKSNNMKDSVGLLYEDKLYDLPSRYSL